MLNKLYEAAFGDSQDQAVTESLDEAAEQRLRLAARIAINRTVAGVHYPVDSAAGAVLGITLGEYLAALAHPVTIKPRAFDGTNYGRADFYRALVKRMLDGEVLPDGDGQVVGKLHDDITLSRPSPNFAWVWKQAKKEVLDRWGS